MITDGFISLAFTDHQPSPSERQKSRWLPANDLIALDEEKLVAGVYLPESSSIRGASSCFFLQLRNPLFHCSRQTYVHTYHHYGGWCARQFEGNDINASADINSKSTIFLVNMLMFQNSRCLQAFARRKPCFPVAFHHSKISRKESSKFNEDILESWINRHKSSINHMNL